MKKQSTFTYRVEDELQAAFKEICERRQISMASAIRNLLRMAVEAENK